jgi:hypothetical protein
LAYFAVDEIVLVASQSAVAPFASIGFLSSSLSDHRSDSQTIVAPCVMRFSAAFSSVTGQTQSNHFSDTAALTSTIDEQ